MGFKQKKSPDFEVNLLPVISILAVVISILLLSTVWVKVGTFDLNQAFGTEKQDNKQSSPSLWVQFENDGSLRLVIKDADIRKSLSATTIREKTTADRVMAVQTFAQKVKRAVPGLHVALILPAADSAYQDVIAVMDILKKEQIADIGIAPL